MADFKEPILRELDTMRRKEIVDKQRFKVAAYTKVIQQIEELPAVRSYDDLATVTGIGEKIREKIREIIRTGALRSAEKAREEKQFDVYNTLMKVHGIGPAKAKQLIDSGVRNIASLRSAVQVNPKILSNIQKAGLKYYEDIHERIPREEIAHHEDILQRAFTDHGVAATIVGSYRRGLPSSGDIDVLVTGDQNDFVAGLIKLHRENYIIETLAEGPTKGLYITRLSPLSKARRVDILYTPPHKYPYAVLYFTGSKEFNIAMRKWALDHGYSLNEHGLTNMNTGEFVEGIDSERHVFDFLGMKYVPPMERTDGRVVVAAPSTPVQKKSLKIIRIPHIVQEHLREFSVPLGKKVRNDETAYYFSRRMPSSETLKVTLTEPERIMKSALMARKPTEVLNGFDEKDVNRFKAFI